MIRYEKMKQGVFLSRPNRFVAHVRLDGREEVCHVKNTGRCRELLLPGAEVWCQHHDDPGRKTAWSRWSDASKQIGRIPTDPPCPFAISKRYSWW